MAHTSFTGNCRPPQLRTAEELGIGQSGVGDLIRDKWEKFSLDMLITLAARAGERVELALT